MVQVSNEFGEFPDWNTKNWRGQARHFPSHSFPKLESNCAFELTFQDWSRTWRTEILWMKWLDWAKWPFASPSTRIIIEPDKTIINVEGNGHGEESKCAWCHRKIRGIYVDQDGIIQSHAVAGVSGDESMIAKRTWAQSDLANFLASHAADNIKSLEKSS